MPEPATGVVLFHNARCRKSRAVLALIREAGIEPRIVDYLEHPPTRAALAAMVADAGIEVPDAARRDEPAFAALGLDAATDDALLDAMAAHPVRIQRPFVVAPTGTRLCRPQEVVLELLPLLGEAGRP